MENRQICNPTPPPDLSPPDTARAAQAAYSRRYIYLSVGDRLDALLNDIHLDDISPLGTPSRLRRPSLALVTFFQFLEKLSDLQAIDAAMTRIDWKYALHLSMSYSGMEANDLCIFRQRLLSSPDKRQNFQRLLERLGEKGSAAPVQEQPLDTLHVLAEICTRTRLDIIMISMRNVLQALAAHQAGWLSKISLPHWFSRYVAPNRRPILAGCIQGQEAIGADMAFLLEAINRADMPQLNALKEVQEFYRVWSEQFDPICLEGVKLYPYCYFCGSPQSFETCSTGDSLA